MNKLRFILFALIAMTIVACGDSTQKKRVGPKKTTTSQPWELLVVANKDWLQAPAGSILMETLNSEIPCLPASEPYFRTMSVNPRGFSKTFQGFANIIFAEVDKKYDKAEMKLSRNNYAKPQLLMSITAPSDEEFAEFVSSHSQSILNTFIDAELERTKDMLTSHHSNIAYKQAKKQFGYTIYAPAEIDAVKTGKNFMWASSDKLDNRYNLCIYTYPYDKTDFTQESIIAHRDSVMKINIKGEKDYQHMATQPLMSISRLISLNGNDKIIEVRGLWTMTNDMMGGPFVSYTQVDTTTNKVIVAEGFVYAPEKRKRELIRSLEAALRTLEINN